MPAAKPPPGRSWPRREQEHRGQDHDGEQQPDEHEGHHQPARAGRISGDAGGRSHSTVTRHGSGEAFGCRPEAPEQRVDRQRDRRDDENLPQSVEPAKIDEE